jgi:tetratricopeptide (TPR) repeat protein
MAGSTVQHIVSAALAAATWLIVVPVSAQQPQYADECSDSAGKRFSIEVRISGCTAAIRSGKYSGKGLFWVFLQRGIAYSDKKDYESAIADYNEAIRLNPQDAKAFYDRGNAWRGKGDLNHAIADYAEAIRLDPNHTNSYNNRGSLWNAKGDPDRAIADLNEAIRLDPNYANPYNNRTRTTSTFRPL